MTAGITTGVKINTSTSVQQIENLLESVCSGDWGLSIEAIASDLSKKEIAVFFAQEDDKEAFKQAYKDF